MLLKLKPLSLALSSSALLLLSACGGGDGDGTASPGAPSGSTSLSGKVTVDQGIKNAVVCLDLNANNACDATEPTSAPTGTDGAYSLTYDPAKVTAAQVAGASLIAPMVPGAATDAATTVDTADPTQGVTSSAYVLRQAPGKSGGINPLTSLVAAGIAQGMTESVARTNVAVQLGISEAKIDAYQDDPAFDPAEVQDNARMMARTTAAALQAGVSLEVVDQTGAVSASAGNLATLNYSDASNYYVRTLDVKGSSSGPALIADNRSGMTNGAATSAAVLYSSAYLSSAGWLHCVPDVPLPATMGTPSRNTYCNALKSVTFAVASDLAGQSMASVVTAMQEDPSTNVINNARPTASLVAALGSATFPANASVQARTNVNLNAPIYINNLNADGFAATITSLEQLIASYPSAAVTLATGRGTLGLGLADSETSVLRVTFSGATSPTAGAVQFYRCDYNPSKDSIANCVTTQKGTYAISTINGVRVVRYSGNAPTIMNHTRLHTEVTQGVPGITDGAFSGPRVFVARESKATLAFRQSVAKRLNSTAWAALKSQLGI